MEHPRKEVAPEHRNGTKQSFISSNPKPCPRLLQVHMEDILKGLKKAVWCLWIGKQQRPVKHEVFLQSPVFVQGKGPAAWEPNFCPFNGVIINLVTITRGKLWRLLHLREPFDIVHIISPAFVVIFNCIVLIIAFEPCWLESWTSRKTASGFAPLLKFP